MGKVAIIDLGDGSHSERDTTAQEDAQATETATENAAIDQATSEADNPLREARDQYQTMINELDQGDNQMMLGNDAGWNALTTAQKADRLRTVMLGSIRHERKILAALKRIVGRMVADDG